MFLADTSIWVDHLRDNDPKFLKELEAGNVFMHPFVMGEILLGSLADRDIIEKALGSMPKAIKASDREVLLMIRSSHVYGRGIGWVDAHLLVSARLTGVPLLTRDRRLARVAKELEIS